MISWSGISSIRTLIIMSNKNWAFRSLLNDTLALVLALRLTNPIRFKTLFAHDFVSSIGPPLHANKMQSSLLMIPWAQDITMSVLLTATFSLRQRMYLLTYSSRASPSKYGLPVFFCGNCVMSTSFFLFIGTDCNFLFNSNL